MRTVFAARAFLFAMVVAAPTAAQGVAFARADELAPTPLAPLVAIADFTGDGLDDLLGPISCIGVGSGLFAAAVPGPSLAVAFDAAELSARVAVADFNQDGLLDAVQTGPTGQLSYVHLGGGLPAPPNAFPASSLVHVHIAAGDVDGDGDPDLLTQPFFSFPRLLINQGSGVFTLQDGWYGLMGALRWLVEDLDGDGFADVVGTADASNAVYAQRSFGNGTFDVPYALAPPGSTASGPAAVGDADGDGRRDVLFGYLSGGVAYAALARLLPGTPWFTFAAPVAWPAPASARTLVDLDQDGASEIVVSAAAGLEVRRFLAGAVTAPTHVYPVWPGALQKIEADGDGRTDLAALWFRVNASATERRHEVDVLLNDGTGGLVPQSGTSDPVLAANASHKAVLADADGDGDVDFVGYTAVGGGGGAPLVARNDGRGTFVPASPAPCSGCPTGGYSGAWHPDQAEFPGAVLDADGDGDADLLVYTDSPPEGYAYLRNDGPNGFAVASTGTLPNRISTTTADLNGDGFADAATVSYPSIYVQYGGPAGLGAPTVLMPSFGAGLHAVDLDFDGDVDLLQRTFVPFGPNGVSAAINDGTGGFALTPLAVSGPWLTGDLSTGDVDGDGQRDLIVGDSWLRRTAPLSYLGQGSISGNPAYANDRFSFGDVEGDGDLDALSNRGRLFLNAGTGIFAESPLSATASFLPDWGSPALADVDGDGDLDAAEAHGTILTNLSRQLESLRPMRADRPFDFRLSGAPNAPWLAAAALDTLPAPIPFAPFGRLDLDPALAVVFSSGVLDASGRFTLVETLDAASAAALAGVPLMVQAVVVGADGLPRLTNARRVVAGTY